MRLESFSTKKQQQIFLGKLNVLVGPNNVGKSQLLRDIYTKMDLGEAARTIIIESFNFDFPESLDKLTNGIFITDHPSNIKFLRLTGIHPNIKEGLTIEIPKPLSEFDRIYKDNKNIVLGDISKLKVAFLDASSRLEMAKSAPAGSQADSPMNLLQALVRKHNRTLLNELQEVFNRAFDMTIELDYSELGFLKFRVAKKFEKNIPENPIDRYPIMSTYPILDFQGDGFKSFVGIVSTMLLCKDRIILIDEPEAFLHPSQIRVLGNWISTYSVAAGNQIIIATHNANFLNGILSGNAEVLLYRFNRIDDDTLINRVPSPAIDKLARSPLLSSQPVLESLFYKGIVICEADADRSIYQTVSVKEFQNENVLFLHAYGKHNFKNIIPTITQAFVPVRVISDIDLLNSKNDFREIIAALSPSGSVTDYMEKRDGIAEAIEEKEEREIIADLIDDLKSLIENLEHKNYSLSESRRQIESVKRKASKWSNIKHLGIDGMIKKVKYETKELMDNCKKLGLFIVPSGQLESWIDLGTVAKNVWIGIALDKLTKGECPLPLREFVEEVLLSINN